MTSTEKEEGFKKYVSQISGREEGVKKACCGRHRYGGP